MGILDSDSDSDDSSSSEGFVKRKAPVATKPAPAAPPPAAPPAKKKKSILDSSDSDSSDESSKKKVPAAAPLPKAEVAPAKKKKSFLDSESDDDDSDDSEAPKTKVAPAPPPAAAPVPSSPASQPHKLPNKKSILDSSDSEDDDDDDDDDNFDKDSTRKEKDADPAPPNKEEPAEKKSILENSHSVEGDNDSDSDAPNKMGESRGRSPTRRPEEPAHNVKLKVDDKKEEDTVEEKEHTEEEHDPESDDDPEDDDAEKGDEGIDRESTMVLRDVINTVRKHSSRLQRGAVSVDFVEPLVTGRLEYVQKQDSARSVNEEDHVAENHHDVPWYEQDYEELPWYAQPDLDEDDALTALCKKVLCAEGEENQKRLDERAQRLEANVIGFALKLRNRARSPIRSDGSIRNLTSSPTPSDGVIRNVESLTSKNESILDEDPGKWIIEDDNKPTYTGECIEEAMELPVSVEEEDEGERQGTDDEAADMDRVPREEIEKAAILEFDRLEEEERQKAEAKRLQTEEEERQVAEAERFKKEHEERLQKDEEEERIRIAEEDDRLRIDDEERHRREEEEKLRKEEEQLKLQNEKLLKLQEEERLRREEEERVKEEEEEEEEEEERLRIEEEEKLRKEEEAQLRLEEEKKLQFQEEEERRRNEEEAQLRLEEEKRIQFQKEETRRQEGEERLRKAEEERVRIEGEARLRLQEEERLRLEEEDRVKQEGEEKLRVEEEVRRRKEEEEKLRMEQEEEQIRLGEEKIHKLQEEERLRNEEERRGKVEEEKLRLEQGEKLREEAMSLTKEHAAAESLKEDKETNEAREKQLSMEATKTREVDDRERQAEMRAEQRVKDRWAIEKEAFEAEEHSKALEEREINPFEAFMALASDFVMDITDPLPETNEKRPSLADKVKSFGGDAYSMTIDGGNLATCLESFGQACEPSTFHLELPNRLTDVIRGRICQVAEILTKNSTVKDVSVIVPSNIDEEVAFHADVIRIFGAIGSLQGLQNLSIESSSMKNRPCLATSAVVTTLRIIASRYQEEKNDGLRSLCIKNVTLVDSNDDLADFAEAMSSISEIPTLRSAQVEIEFSTLRNGATRR
jgi:hypothetical protein